MSTQPKKYTKEEFVEFLKKNLISDELISEIEKIPLTYEDNYNLNIVVSNIDNGSSYTYELNYYDNNNLKYAFKHSIEVNCETALTKFLSQLSD